VIIPERKGYLRPDSEKKYLSIYYKELLPVRGRYTTFRLNALVLV
jgi:hypothetical protein